MTFTSWNQHDHQRSDQESGHEHCCGSLDVRRRALWDRARWLLGGLRCSRPVADVEGMAVSKRRLVTLEEAVQLVVKRHGGVRAAERATGVDKSFISRLMNGHKVAPSADTLRALGLRAVPLYEVWRNRP